MKLHWKARLRKKMRKIFGPWFCRFVGHPFVQKKLRRKLDHVSCRRCKEWVPTEQYELSKFPVLWVYDFWMFLFKRFISSRIIKLRMYIRMLRQNVRNLDLDAEDITCFLSLIALVGSVLIGLYTGIIKISQMN